MCRALLMQRAAIVSVMLLVPMEAMLPPPTR